MGCEYITGTAPEFPMLEEVSVPPAAPLPPPDNLDPLPEFNGTPEVPNLLAADPAPAVPDAPPVDAGEPLGWNQLDPSGMMSTLTNATANLSATATAAALGSLGTMGGYTPTFAPIETPTINAGAGAPGGTPPTFAGGGVTGTITATIPEKPNLPELPTIDIWEPPPYTIEDVAIMDIPLPDPFTVLSVPEPEFLPVPEPVEPDYPIPPVPTLEQLTIPDAPTVEIPIFDAVLGLAPAAPDARLLYSEVEYNTALLTAMNARLASMVGDLLDSGIDPAVEQAIWDRAADREAMLTHRATGEALRLMKARGFTIPEAAMARIVQQALQGGLNRDSTRSREIIIEQAKLRQQNFKFSMQTAVALEGKMIEKASAANQRALEAAKATASAEIHLFNARVQLFLADVQGFAMRAEVFKTRLQAALAEVEIYKAKLEAAKAVGELNTQLVAIYKAQISGVMALVDVFKARVTAAKEKAESNKAFIESYRSRVKALESEVEAKNLEYEAFAAQVKGEGTKVAIYGDKVTAYRSRVGAYGAQTRAELKVDQLRVKVDSEFPVELFKAEVDAYREGAMATVASIRANAASFSATMRAHAASIETQTSFISAEARANAARAQAFIEQANLSVDVSSKNLHLAARAADSVQANLRTMGQISGQIAAATASTQSMHTTVSESGVNSKSNLVSDSRADNFSNTSNTTLSQSSTNATSYNATSGVTMGRHKTINHGRTYNRGSSTTYSERTSTNNQTQISAHNTYLGAVSNDFVVSVTNSCEDITNHSGE